ncbi:MAG: 3'-5' exonuclease [Betaproteobacteria bacterium]|nr:3'-5' exonuclease [Betaproteobacteria bacterium]
MSWLSRLLRPPVLDEGQRAAIAAYRRLVAPEGGTPLKTIRFVVADVETSGLNPSRDRLISIGAVTADSGRVQLGRSFEVVLRQDVPSDISNILIHEIDGTTQMSGAEPAQALTQFLAFVGKAPLVGYHAAFDNLVISRATERFLGLRLQNRWLDLAVLAPALLREQAPRSGSLDDWLAIYGIDNYARHDAVADALATAELLLIVLAAARDKGRERLAELIDLEQGERWLGTR